jgi:prepilin peptidase CpaA
MQPLSLAALFTLLLWAVLCAKVDARERRIPNTFIATGAVVALTFLIALRATFTGEPLTASAAGFLASLAFTLPGYALKRLGAGDVKMLAVVGLATAPSYVLITIVVAALAMVVWQLSSMRLWPHFSERIRGQLAALAPPLRRAPYAPFMTIGMFAATLITLL